MSASAPVPTASASRRPQPRKKANDDASYFGPSTSSTSTTGTKRQAAEKLDGEPRGKRKRVDAVPTTQTSAKASVPEGEIRLSLVCWVNLPWITRPYSFSKVEFSKMSTHVLQRYLTQFDIVPSIYPSPVLPDDPPPPNMIGTVVRHVSRAPSPPSNQTPANRPRRESRDPQRRSSRLAEDDLPYRTPALPVIQELHGALANIVEKHFREVVSINGREEVDTLASFMCAVEKAKGNRNRA